jgi:hypothetical protein
MPATNTRTRRTETSLFTTPPATGAMTEKDHLADALDRLSNEIGAVRNALDDAATSIEWCLKKLADEFEAFTWEGRRK